MDANANHRCEWPARRGVTHKCGKPARFVVAASPQRDSWSRHVCGTHANRAERIGWVLIEVAKRPLVVDAQYRLGWPDDRPGLGMHVNGVNRWVYKGDVSGCHLFEHAEADWGERVPYSEEWRAIPAD